ncbi:MAG: transporter [Nitrospirae bacterium]|nr:transporter [Nitrospirota bacterium]
MLTPTAVWAAHPLQVKDTATEGRGNILIELTGDYSKDNELRSTKLTSIFTVGAGEHVNFSLEVPYRTLDPGPMPEPGSPPDPGPVNDAYASGKGDLRLKFKQQVFENEVKQSMAYEIYVDMPTGDVEKGLGTNNVVWGVNVIDSQECHNNAFHVNIGYEVRGRDMKRWHYAHDYAFKFGLAAEHKLTDSFRFLMELSGESRKETDAAIDTQSYSRPFTFLAGFIYDISKSWYVDLGVRAGLNKYAEDYSVLAGTAWRF